MKGIPPRVITPKGVIIGGTHKLMSFSEFDALMFSWGILTLKGKLVRFLT